MILASASPRRIEMIQKAGIDPVVMPASIIETFPSDMGPEDATMFLAMKKATAVLEEIKSSEGHDKSDVILAADTVVVSDRKIIGKPRDPQEAFSILSSLRSRSHHVITGCCLIKPATMQKFCFYEDTEVWFKDFTDEELEAYVHTPEPYDKAGGYAIQGTFGKYVDHSDGDFDNVVGLPLTRVLTFLKYL